MSDEIYTIELTEEQLNIVADCLEMTSRIMLGQIDSHTLFPFDNIINEGEKFSNREIVDKHLIEIKKVLFPTLYPNSSFGLSKNKKSDHLYEMYKQIRNATTNHSSSLRLTHKPLIKVSKSTKLTRDRRIDNIIDNE